MHCLVTSATAAAARHPTRSLLCVIAYNYVVLGHVGYLQQVPYQQPQLAISDLVCCTLCNTAAHCEQIQPALSLMTDMAGLPATGCILGQQQDLTNALQ